MEIEPDGLELDKPSSGIVLESIPGLRNTAVERKMSDEHEDSVPVIVNRGGVSIVLHITQNSSDLPLKVLHGNRLEMCRVRA